MQKTQETWLRSLGQEDPLEKEMATHSRLEIPWTEEPEAGGGGGGVATVHGVTKESVKAQVWPQHEENHLLLQQHLDSCSIPGVSTHRLFPFSVGRWGQCQHGRHGLVSFFLGPFISPPIRGRTHMNLCVHTQIRRRCGFSPWVRKIPWRTKWQPAPVFLPGTHGQRSLAGYSPWDCKESDTTEHTHTQI